MCLPLQTHLARVWFRSFVKKGGLSSTLRRVFDRSEAALGHSIPIRKTASGIWVPTPLSVFEAALPTFEELGLFGGTGPTHPIVDAGTGDGRIPCVLASVDSSPPVYGVELDPTLFARALENLATLDAKGLADRNRVHLVEGDYCDLATYDGCGLDFRQAGLVFNYPDGNENRLARFVRDAGGDTTTLCLLTHDQEVRVSDLELRVRRDIFVKDELPWLLSLYCRPR